MRISSFTKLHRSVWLAVTAIAMTCSEPLGQTETIDADYQTARDAFYDGDTTREITSEEKFSTAPDGYYLPLGICQDQICHFQQRQTVLEMEYAYLGSYQAQRNLAYCLTNDCEANINIYEGKLIGCAWRIVILASGHPQLDSSDISNYETCFEGLSETEAKTSRTQATRLFRQIYKTDIREEWK